MSDHYWDGVNLDLARREIDHLRAEIDRLRKPETRDWMSDVERDRLLMENVALKKRVGWLEDAMRADGWSISEGFIAKGNTFTDVGVSPVMLKGNG